MKIDIDSNFDRIKDEVFDSISLEKKINKCLYCDSKQKEDLHFTCEDCGTGMCDECYDNLIEHTKHYHEVLDSIEDEYVINSLQKQFGEGGPAYICEKCLGKHYKKEDIELQNEVIDLGSYEDDLLEK